MKARYYVFMLIVGLCGFASIFAQVLISKSWYEVPVCFIAATVAAYNGEMAWRELLDAIHGRTSKR